MTIFLSLNLYQTNIQKLKLGSLELIVFFKFKHLNAEYASLFTPISQEKLYFRRIDTNLSFVQENVKLKANIVLRLITEIIDKINFQIINQITAHNFQMVVRVASRIYILLNKAIEMIEVILIIKMEVVANLNTRKRVCHLQ